VRKGRQAGKGVRGIVGIRQRDLKKDQEIGTIQLKKTSAIKECDPFFRHPITPYTELSEHFTLSKGKAEDNEVIDVVLTDKGSDQKEDDPEKENYQSADDKSTNHQGGVDPKGTPKGTPKGIEMN
jgi:hypothetical protein